MVCAALATMMIAASVKVTRMVWKGDKFLPLMFYMLSASLVCSIGYLLLHLYANHTNANCGEMTKGFNCWTEWFSILPEFFLAIAVSCNIAKWIYFLMRIRTFIKIEAAVKVIQMEEEE